MTGSSAIALRPDEALALIFKFAWLHVPVPLELYDTSSRAYICYLARASISSVYMVQCSSAPAC